MFVKDYVEAVAAGRASASEAAEALLSEAKGKGVVGAANQTLANIGKKVAGRLKVKPHFFGGGDAERNLGLLAVGVPTALAGTAMISHKLGQEKARDAEIERRLSRY